MRDHWDMGAYVTRRGLRVPERAIRASFSRASGPGGQHVNTSSTRVQVRIVLVECGFDDALAERLTQKLGPEIRVDDASSRSQWRNRSTAIRRAFDLLDEASLRDVKRVPTRASRGAQRRRLEDKARRARTKQLRRNLDEG